MGGDFLKNGRIPTRYAVSIGIKTGSERKDRLPEPKGIFFLHLWVGGTRHLTVCMSQSIDDQWGNTRCEDGTNDHADDSAKGDDKRPHNKDDPQD